MNIKRKYIAADRLGTGKHHCTHSTIEVKVTKRMNRYINSNKTFPIWFSFELWLVGVYIYVYKQVDRKSITWYSTKRILCITFLFTI